ncbi:P-loop containing nucleoside triphosphate hydrolase protein [Morchella snyderi]|nr:P-loop containing nucleoside triphosphate hydrolase protein [Morchella snyderi]
MHKGYSNNYIRGCKLRQLETGNGKALRHLPARFVLSEDTLKREQFGTTGTSLGGNKLSREEALGLHEALTTGKFYTLNEQMFESIQASKKCGVLPEFAFDVSEEETEIIRWWKSSVLILGRSGTGKTTCLVFKLLAGYLTRIGAGLEPRQIFLTRSPILAGKIARYIRRLIDSQLGRLDNPLLEVEQNDTGTHVIRESTGHDHDDADRNLFTIGKNDWPLVCTFDQFCGLLENTLNIEMTNPFYRISDRTDFAPANSVDIQLNWEHRRVDFSKFKRAYWPSFPLHLRKGISVDLVFAELMAVIKGGNYASGFLPLTKQGYLKISSRLAPTFLEGSKERESVWKMYELYENRRRGIGEWDDLDRCRDIRKGLSNDQELLERLQTVIGECYVDEVQDLRVGEVEILLRVVGNPRGVHLAGDTAQCISRDSTFRFQDIKALFFQLFGSMATKGHGSSKTAEESLEKPRLFLLAKNYRSHQGILALASSVVDLLWKVFPDVIDKLQPEVGTYLGPKPKLFIGFSSDMFSKKLFGAVDVVENIAEFGAEQVILVRDDEARNTLRDEIGTINLILTIVESKGMEFDDVLLFNYFSGSPAGPSFRALVSMEEDLKTKQGTGLIGFDRRKHAVLSAELRGLYVAITRPRARLWLIEEHGENITAMTKLWSKGPDGGLVDIVLRGDKNVSGARCASRNQPGLS